MKNGIYLICLVLFHSPIVAQTVKYDYNWVLGDSDSVTVAGVTMNFNQSPITISHIRKPIELGVYNSTISDAQGNLLFYANGCKIVNRFHEIVENGDSINSPGMIFDGFCGTGGSYPSSTGLLFLPQPQNDTFYYMFHNWTDFFNADQRQIPATMGLRYTLINRYANNGHGRVVRKNQTLIADTLGYDLTACKHANGRDWWIIAPQTEVNRYWRTLFDTSGTQVLGEQTIGSSPTARDEASGNACFTPNGRKYLRFMAASGLFVFDFDRQTGLLSNFKRVPIDVYYDATSVSVSANSRFAYICSRFKVVQVDLEAADIAASQVVVAEYDGFRAPFPTWFYMSQLAPDCRIYIAPKNGSFVMHYIKYPDRKGLACEVVQHGIRFPNEVTNFMTIPNHPNYRLGITPTYPCDSMIQLRVGTKEIAPPQNSITLYPNPARDYVELHGIFPFENGAFQLFDNIGRLVFSHPLQQRDSDYTIPLSNIQDGLYFFRIITDSGKNQGSGKVQIVR